MPCPSPDTIVLGFRSGARSRRMHSSGSGLAKPDPDTLLVAVAIARLGVAEVSKAIARRDLRSAQSRSVAQSREVRLAMRGEVTASTTQAALPHPPGDGVEAVADAQPSFERPRRYHVLARAELAPAPHCSWLRQLDRPIRARTGEVEFVVPVCSERLRSKLALREECSQLPSGDNGRERKDRT